MSSSRVHRSRACRSVSFFSSERRDWHTFSLIFLARDNVQFLLFSISHPRTVREVKPKERYPKRAFHPKSEERFPYRAFHAFAGAPRRPGGGRVLVRFSQRTFPSFSVTDFPRVFRCPRTAWLGSDFRSKPRRTASRHAPPKSPLQFCGWFDMSCLMFWLPPKSLFNFVVGLICPV